MDDPKIHPATHTVNRDACDSRCSTPEGMLSHELATPGAEWESCAIHQLARQVLKRAEHNQDAFKFVRELRDKLRDGEIDEREPSGFALKLGVAGFGIRRFEREMEQRFGDWNGCWA